MHKKSPEIRFKGFTDDWEQRKFSNIVNRVSKQSNDSNLPKVEFEDIVSGEGRLNKDISRKFDDRKGIVFEPNFILFGKLRPYLKNWLFPNFKGIALGDFWVFEPNDSSSIFNYYLIQSNKYQTVANLSSGTKMPRSDWKTVSETEFSIPVNIEEQTKIGSFFKQLDNTITLHQDAIQRQQVLKKALLQKLFPVNGEQFPTVRFATFKEEWEQRKWSETIDISTEMVNPKTGEYDSLPHIGPGNIESFTGRILDNVKSVKEDNLISGKFHFYSGDVIYGKINPQLGKYAMVDFEGLASADSYVLNTKNGVSQTFLFTILQGTSFYKYSVSVSMRTGMPKINRDELNQYRYSAPSVVEQEKIGTFFKQLDDTITLHQDAIHKFQLLKQSLLQKMFVN